MQEKKALSTTHIHIYICKTHTYRQYNNNNSNGIISNTFELS